MKNRTMIGIVCIILALVLTFGGTMLVNNIQTKTVTVITAATNIKKGDKINAASLSTAEINDGAVTTNDLKFKNEKEAKAAIEQIAGKYTTVDIVEGDFITKAKLTANSTNIDAALEGLNGEKIAMSIPVSSFAGHLSGKLEAGDIVSIMFTTKDKKNIESKIPMAFQYLRVLTLTTSKGIDTNETAAATDEGIPMPNTITFLLYPVQAAMLRNELENGAKMYLTLVYRGEEEAGKQLTDITEEYARALEEASKKVAENNYENFKKDGKINTDNSSFKEYYAKHKDEFVKIINGIFEDIFGMHTIVETNESAFDETTTVESEAE